MADRSLRLLDGGDTAVAPPDPGSLLAGVPCCAELRNALTDGRPSIAYAPAVRAVHLLDAPPSRGMILLRHCPFCGDALLPELRGQRDEIAIEAGFEPHAFDPPEGFLERFGTDTWWRARLDRDPAAFLVALPQPGDILAIGRDGLEVIVVATHPAFMDESLLIVPADQLRLATPRLVVTSTREFSQGRWPVVRRDPRAAARLAARIRFVREGGWPGSAHWVLADAGSDLRGSDARAPLDELIVNDLDVDYSIEVEALLSTPAEDA